jgi:hypothetical protein
MKPVGGYANAAEVVVRAVMEGKTRAGAVRPYPVGDRPSSRRCGHPALG